MNNQIEVIFILEIININKSFGEKNVLKNISFEIEEGKVLGLLGRNGAGKTTTLKIILDLIKQDNGEVLWKKNKIDKKIKIGYLPEERGLYPKSTVRDQLFFFGQLEGIKKNELEREIDYWLKRFNIMEYKNLNAGELSKGNQQKIQIISSLIHNPEIIILDEPFSGLDPVNADNLSEIISELIKKGKTVILSSHQMEQVEKFVDKICFIKNGEINLFGDLKDIKKEYEYKKIRINNEPKNSEILSKNRINYEIENKEIVLKKKNLEESFEIINLLKENGAFLEKIIISDATLNEIFIERMV